MSSRTLLTVSSAIALSLLASIGFFVSLSFAQQNMTNMTTATNETGGMMRNQTNQTGGNETQQGRPLEQLGRIFGGP